MNKSPLTTILTGALALSALTSLVLCYLYIQYTREARLLQAPATQAVMKQNLVTPLLNDIVEYSKKNPAIVPVLEANGVKIQPAQAAQPAKPAK
jgi:hypothetical protein